MIVLDASALLAFLFREPGHEQVAVVLGSSYISTVNQAEVIGRFVRDGFDSKQVLQRLSATPVNFIAFSSEQAAIAARLLPQTRPLGLSLGDRACLALALQRKLPVMTADRTWAQLNVGVSVQMIR
jgi:ribonuclease VapC